LPAGHLAGGLLLFHDLGGYGFAATLFDRCRAQPLSGQFSVNSSTPLNRAEFPAS
jgi:hypothetical protein